MGAVSLEIVHATTVHRWDDGRIFERQCRSLAAHGHSVTLLAPGPPGSSLVHGVRVVGIGEPERRSARMTRLVATVGRSLRDLRPDVAVFHDPELLSVVAARGRGLRSTALVYDAHEDYRAQMRDKEWLPVGVRRAAGAILGLAELAAASRADLVLCATPDIAARFGNERTHVVLNRPSIDGLPPVDDIGGATGAVRTVCYVGDLRVVRGAYALIDAMELVNRHRPVRLQIAGRISPPTLEQDLALRPGWRHVDLLGWRTRDEINCLMSDSDVGVLPFLAAENHVVSQPNKLFEYLLMGLPVVASDFERWRSLAAEVDGRFRPSRPGDAESLAAGILEVLDAGPTDADRRAAARRARSVFSWESIESDYVTVMESLRDSVATR